MTRNKPSRLSPVVVAGGSGCAKYSASVQPQGRVKDTGTDDSVIKHIQWICFRFRGNMTQEISCCPFYYRLLTRS